MWLLPFNLSVRDLRNSFNFFTNSNAKLISQIDEYAKAVQKNAQILLLEFLGGFAKTDFQAGMFYFPRLLWKAAEGGVMKLLTSGNIFSAFSVSSMSYVKQIDI